MSRSKASPARFTATSGTPARLDLRDVLREAPDPEPEVDDARRPQDQAVRAGARAVRRDRHARSAVRRQRADQGRDVVGAQVREVAVEDHHRVDVVDERVEARLVEASFRPIPRWTTSRRPTARRSRRAPATARSTTTSSVTSRATWRTRWRSWLARKIRSSGSGSWQTCLRRLETAVRDDDPDGHASRISRSATG